MAHFLRSGGGHQAEAEGSDFRGTGASEEVLFGCLRWRLKVGKTVSPRFSAVLEALDFVEKEIVTKEILQET